MNHGAPLRACLVLALLLPATACDEHRSAPQTATDATVEATPATPETTTSAEATPPPPTETQPAAAPQPAILHVVSDPPGATVYVGAQYDANMVVNAETGRVACEATPCDVTLIASDVKPDEGITMMMRKMGYYDHIGVLSDGHKKIAAGGTYEFSARLNPMQ